jgi:hypothetical protein
MAQTFRLRAPEQAYLREAMFAIELLDAVTLERVSEGVTVVAEGLRGQPIVNTGGLFVWRVEPLDPLTKVSVDPGLRPYEAVERLRADLRLPPGPPSPLTTIELAPRVDYDFAAGVTGIRGTLLEDRNLPRTAVTDAEVRLRWLDADGFWQDAPTRSHTDMRGDFAAVLRLAPTELPQLDAMKQFTVRLQATRGAEVRESLDVALPPGRVTDSSALDALTFAWTELLP